MKLIGPLFAKIQTAFRSIASRACLVGKHSGKILIDRSSTVHWTVVFRPWGGNILIAERVLLDRHVGLHADGGSIRIGAGSSMNAGALIIAGGEVEIGENVLIAPGCVLVASNHCFSRPDVPMAFQGIVKGRVVVEDDVWLGAGAKVLTGVTVGRGAIVGAGAVVTSDVEPRSIVVGVPARKIGMRPS